MLQRELALFLPEPVRSYVMSEDKPITEIRLRVNRPIQLVYFASEDRILGGSISAGELRKIALSMMEHSYYACEEELNRGYFTMANGCRVGISGSFSTVDGEKYHLRTISSLCIRIARAAVGCAEGFVERILENRPVSALVLSAPGMGKTTLLRDAARILSEKGYRIGIADERHEIAACINGVPGFDLGIRSDVIDGCPKAMAIEMLIRSLAPQIIITDEIGNSEDLEAIREATRMGVSMIASAHASSLEVFENGSMGKLLREGLFEIAVWLGGQPGHIQEIRRYRRGEVV